MELFLHDGHKHVDRDGDPYLGLHCVLRCAEELFDPKVLFDPSEESFDEPAAAIQIGNGVCRQLEIVGEKNKMLIAGGIEVTNTPELLRVILLGGVAAKGDYLIASESCCLVDCKGFEPIENQVVLGSDDEGCWRLMDAEQAFEIGVAAVHYVYGARFYDQLVEDVDLVHLAVGDDDNCWNGASQIEKSVQFDRCLRFAEMRPWEDREAEVDDAGIESIDRFLEHQAKVVVEVELPGLCDQHVREVGIDAPVADLIRIGQCVAGHFAADAHMIQLSLGSSQTRLNVAQALAVRQLGEGHAAELIAA